jgi:type IV secretion system protein VirB10
MAAGQPPGDPRPFARLPGEAGVMPVVAKPRTGVSNAAIGIGALLAGLLLFAVLDARRRAPTAPAVSPRAADRLATPVAPPPLYVPPATPAPVVVPVVRAPAAPTPAPPPPPLPPQVIYVPQPMPVPSPQAEPPPPPPRVATEPALIVDTGAPAGAPAAAGAASAESPLASATAITGARARAGAFANRGTTVPQGTLIPAVLETALDSTRPGLARAIVSRDVRGFDGSRVLIPRGSRLIGEYRSEAAPGQRRALVNWVRLIRPDGVTIAIGSPAADTLGRGGIKAKVNTHFFERFAGAILQSALDIGVNLASRAGNGTTVILPGATQATSQIIQPAQITPTLKVKPGTSISIFAARDLDFSGAENRR